MDFNSLYNSMLPRTGPTQNTGMWTGSGIYQSTIRDSSYDIRPDSVIIAVMGITGSGKSTFIQHFNSQATIGHSLQSCTSDIHVYDCKLPNGHQIYLVDTPGFDDTQASDTEVLRKLAKWLGDTYGAGIKLSGVIYLHRIFDTRLTGAGMRNLNMFKKLVGRDSLKNVVLATTMWDAIPSAEYAQAEAKENQLKGTESFWKEMVANGSTVTRHDSGKSSALSIVQSIVSKRRVVALEIQREMVDAGIPLERTSAGQALIQEMEKARLEFEERMTKLRSDFQDSLQRQEQEHEARLNESRARLQERMRQNKEMAENLTANRAQRRQNYRIEADNKIERLVGKRREEEQEWAEAAKKTVNQGYWRHPDCYNHWPQDPWHQRNCGHPSFM